MQQYANEFGETDIIPALDRGIFKTDDLVTSTQRENISRAVCHLEHESRDRGSLSAKPDGSLKTVDPSLFPFSFQRSRCLKDSTIGRHDCIDQCGKGQIAGLLQGPEGQRSRSLKGRGCYANDKAWSLRYQWLPFEVRFDENMASTRYACSSTLPCPITVRLTCHLLASSVISTTSTPFYMKDSILLLKGSSMTQSRYSTGLSPASRRHRGFSIPVSLLRVVEVAMCLIESQESIEHQKQEEIRDT